MKQSFSIRKKEIRKKKKTFWENEALLVTSNFSFFLRIFITLYSLNFGYEQTGFYCTFTLKVITVIDYLLFTQVVHDTMEKENEQKHLF